MQLACLPRLTEAAASALGIDARRIGNFYRRIHAAFAGLLSPFAALITTRWHLTLVGGLGGGPHRTQKTCVDEKSSYTIDMLQSQSSSAECVHVSCGKLASLCLKLKSARRSREDSFMEGPRSLAVNAPTGGGETVHAGQRQHRQAKPPAKIPGICRGARVGSSRPACRSSRGLRQAITRLQPCKHTHLRRIFDFAVTALDVEQHQDSQRRLCDRLGLMTGRMPKSALARALSRRCEHAKLASRASRRARSLHVLTPLRCGHALHVRKAHDVPRDLQLPHGRAVPTLAGVRKEPLAALCPSEGRRAGTRRPVRIGRVNCAVMSGSRSVAHGGKMSVRRWTSA